MTSVPASGVTPSSWSASCPSRAVIDVPGRRWVLPLMPLLRGGPRRNGKLLRSAEGVSPKMRTQTLRDLESHGLVVRRVYYDVPPRVEYPLTPLGHSLANTIFVLDQGTMRRYHEMAGLRRPTRRGSRCGVRRTGVGSP